MLAALVGLIAADNRNPQDVTSTLMYGVLVWSVGYRVGLRYSLALAVVACVAHIVNNCLSDDHPQTPAQLLEEASEALLLILLALEGNRLRVVYHELESTRSEATRLHGQLKELLRQGRKAQLALQGVVPATVPGARLCARNLVAQELGGDFFFFHQLQAKTLMVVADVSGKGPSAAMIAATARGICHELADDTLGQPGLLLARLEGRLAGILPEEMFITALACSYDGSDGSLRLAGAGHEPAYVYSDDAIREILSPNLPLGPFAPQEFQEIYLDLGAGGSLLLISDGLTESLQEDGQRLGSQPLLDLLRLLWDHPAELVQKLEALLPAQLTDDVTIVALCAESAERLWDLTPSAPSSLAGK